MIRQPRRLSPKYAAHVFVLAVPLLGGCFETESPVCASGRVCRVGTQCTVAGDWCIEPGGCGDGKVQPGDGEECDDGNHRTDDGCSEFCKVERCGDGVKQQNEVCDEGPRGGPSCDVDCTVPVCGDGTLNVLAGEMCDDGNAVDGDGCSARCKREGCGDHIKDANEDCDWGGVPTVDCDPDCTLVVCGDGYANAAAGEKCDDGNAIGGDRCSSTCQVEVCGNNVKDVLEECDRGGVATSDCDPDCTLPTCGDNYTNAAAFETCDDGNTVDGDGCSAKCTIETCGNNVKDALEECDRGGLATSDCDPDCTLPACGDGYLNAAAGEVCDDGNANDGDGCSAKCKLETCGDFVRDSREECDNGPGATAICDPDCTFVVCGDGYVNVVAGEVCDDGKPPRDGDGCSHDCKSNETCGNGITDSVKGEVCDDGNRVDGDGCSSDCKSMEACGNGILDVGEECDDGRGSIHDDCVVIPAEAPNDEIVDASSGGPSDGAVDASSDAARDASSSVHGDASSDAQVSHFGAGYCKRAYCGDGIVHNEGHGTEQCDDNGVDTKLCNRDCTTARCGDGYVNRAAGEQCDEGADGGSTANCNSDCTWSRCGDKKLNRAAGEQCDPGEETAACDKNCTSAYCGDGELNTTRGEECDDGTQGSASCNSDCTKSRCGDGKVNAQAGEQCDANGETERCDSDCTSVVCGDGHRNLVTEQCDDGNNDDGDGCSRDCHRERCGNGTTDPGESCDDGDDTDLCDKDCTRAHCGDGYTNTKHVARNKGAQTPEWCDEGELNGSYGHCNAMCTAKIGCGDGIQQPEEECDQGDGVNGSPASTCSQECKNKPAEDSGLGGAG